MYAPSAHAGTAHQSYRQPRSLATALGLASLPLLALAVGQFPSLALGALLGASASRLLHAAAVRGATRPQPRDRAPTAT